MCNAFYLFNVFCTLNAFYVPKKFDVRIEYFVSKAFLARPNASYTQIAFYALSGTSMSGDLNVLAGTSMSGT